MSKTITVYTIDELTGDAKKRALSQVDATFGDLWEKESKASIDYFRENALSMDRDELSRDMMPTGYCLDCPLWETFVDSLDEGLPKIDAFHEALKAGFKEWAEDVEYQHSEEELEVFANGNKFYFLSDGTLV